METKRKSNRPRYRITIEFVRDMAWLRGVRARVAVSARDGTGPDLPYEYHADGALYRASDVVAPGRHAAAERILRNLGLRVAS